MLKQTTIKNYVFGRHGTLALKANVNAMIHKAHQILRTIIAFFFIYMMNGLAPIQASPDYGLYDKTVFKNITIPIGGWVFMGQDLDISGPNDNATAFPAMIFRPSVRCGHFSPALFGHRLPVGLLSSFHGQALSQAGFGCPFSTKISYAVSLGQLCKSRFNFVYSAETFNNTRGDTKGVADFYVRLVFNETQSGQFLPAQGRRAATLFSGFGHFPFCFFGRPVTNWKHYVSPIDNSVLQYSIHVNTKANEWAKVLRNIKPIGGYHVPTW